MLPVSRASRSARSPAPLPAAPERRRQRRVDHPDVDEEARGPGRAGLAHRVAGPEEAWCPALPPSCRSPGRTPGRAPGRSGSAPRGSAPLPTSRCGWTRGPPERNRGDWARPANIAVTPNIQVTPSLSTRSKHRSTSQVGMITAVPPLRKVGRNVWSSAATWNSGALTSVTSSPATSTSTSRFRVFQSRLSWVRIGALRPAGRPGGVEHEGGLVRRDGNVDRGGVRSPRAPARSRSLLCGALQREPRPVPGELRHERSVLRRVHEQGRPGVAEHVVDLGAGEAEVQRDEDAAEQVRGEHRLDERGMVGSEVGHPVARARRPYPPARARAG